MVSYSEPGDGIAERDVVVLCRWERTPPNIPVLRLRSQPMSKSALISSTERTDRRPASQVDHFKDFSFNWRSWMIYRLIWSTKVYQNQSGVPNSSAVAPGKGISALSSLKPAERPGGRETMRSNTKIHWC